MNNVLHQRLIDGLGYHVLKGEMPQSKAKAYIKHYQDKYPDDDALDEAVLKEIRNNWGLKCP